MKGKKEEKGKVEKGVEKDEKEEKGEEKAQEEKLRREWLMKTEKNEKDIDGNWWKKIYLSQINPDLDKPDAKYDIDVYLNNSSITILQLYHHYTKTMPSLYYNYTKTIPSLYHHYTITIPSLYHHYTITIL